MNNLPEGIKMEIVSPSGSRLMLFDETHDSIGTDIVSNSISKWRTAYREKKTTIQCKAIKSFMKENKNVSRLPTRTTRSLASY